MARSTVPRLDKPFYSPAELARLASVHPSTILNYIHARRLDAVRLSERTYRIPLRAAMMLLEPGRIRPPRIVERPFEAANLDAFERELGREHRRRRRRG